MNSKKLAMILGISVLLPMFIVLFMQAVYTEPKYEDYCNTSFYDVPMMGKISDNCSYNYGQDYYDCLNQRGQTDFKYDSEGCQVFDKCNFCSLEFENAREVYNRNVFFVLMPFGLIIVILGIYFGVDYLGAAFMFSGLITMFYSTIRYFSDMSKLLRALVILIELLVIIWIGYRKIDRKK